MLSKRTFLLGAWFIATSVTTQVAFAQAPGQPVKSTATPPVAVGEAIHSEAPTVPQRLGILRAYRSIRNNFANRSGNDSDHEAKPQPKRDAELEYFNSGTPLIIKPAEQVGTAKEPARANVQTASRASAKYYHLDDESVQIVGARPNSESAMIPDEEATIAPLTAPSPEPTLVRKVVNIGGDVLQTQAVVTAPMQIQFDENELPEVGTVLQVFHKYPLGWEQIGKLVVTGHSGHQVIAQLQAGTTMRLRAGDRVETRVTKSFRQ
jgi:hypothetical protein